VVGQYLQQWWFKDENVNIPKYGITMHRLMKCNIFNYKYVAQNHNNNSIQFSIIYVLSQELQGQLQKQHSANAINYITHKQKHKDKSHEASLGTII
jgi:hypothetical protein